MLILDDLILGERWNHLQGYFRGYPFSLVVLAPSLEAVTSRDRGRGKRPLGEEWARYLNDVLRGTMAGKGHWIDSSEQTSEEAVDLILERLFLRAF